MNKIKLYSRIVLIFTVPIAMSLITDYIRPVLGDWKCQGTGSMVVSEHSYASDYWTGCNYTLGAGYHDPQWHYGFGHFLWILMGLTLFIVQIVFLVNEFNKVKK